MAGLNENAQWIILMGFVVSFSFFFLATVIDQSTLVGQTTAESVLDFPKNDIRDVRGVIIQSVEIGDPSQVHNDITNISLMRKNAIVNYTVTVPSGLPAVITLHYNNGVTAYDETWTAP